MFKEQLNMSFENIKPSPELLDRISAMMSEEVSRKKPPLQMRAVKYAGIAAAVALAAGGTLLAVNNTNRGINTSDNADLAAGTPTTAAATFVVTANPETAAAVQAAGAEETNAADNGGMSLFAAADEAAEMAIYDAEGATEESEEESADEVAGASAADEADAGSEAAMFIMAAPAPDTNEVSEAGGTADAATADTARDNSADIQSAKMAPAAADEERASAEEETEAPAVPDGAVMEIASIESVDGYDSEDSMWNGDESDDFITPAEPVAADAVSSSAAADNAADNGGVMYTIIVDDSAAGVITDIPASAGHGETVEIRTGVVMDADIIIYADGIPLERTHYDSDYWGYTFTMPDHDVTITAEFSSGKQE